MTKYVFLHEQRRKTYLLKSRHIEKETVYLSFASVVPLVTKVPKKNQNDTLTIRALEMSPHQTVAVCLKLSLGFVKMTECFVTRTAS